MERKENSWKKFTVRDQHYYLMKRKQKYKPYAYNRQYAT